MHYPQGPLQRGMQPLRLSLLHLGILDPSQGRDDFFIDYAGRWSINMSVGSDHPLGSAAYMSGASLKKGPAWFLIDYAGRWSIM